jgi:GT2 family glycosyltransferase
MESDGTTTRDDKIELSVIICTHNPRSDYLNRVLKSLEAQNFAKERWELLLIDNASDVPLSSSFDLSWQPQGRHIVERDLGIAEARRRGIFEAASDILVFVDDDNVLDENYLSIVNTIKQEWPVLGTWGSGSVTLEFEEAPSRHLEIFLPYLAFRDTKMPRWTNVAPCVDATPVGAGICVRKNVAMAYCEMYEQSAVRVTGREGGILQGHDDFEMSYVACRMGLGMGLFPALKIFHLIPKRRVTQDYLIRLYEGSRTSNMMMAYKWQGIPVNSPYTVRGTLSVIKNCVTRRGIDRRMYLANLRATVKARRLIARSLARVGQK